MNNTGALNPEQLVKTIKTSTRDTHLNGLHKIYEKHIHIIEFIYNNGEKLSSSGTVELTGFLGENIEFDNMSLFSLIKKDSSIRTSYFCDFTIDLLNFIIDNLDKNCINNSEVIEELVNFSEHHPYSNASNTENTLKNQYRNLKNLEQDMEVLFSDEMSDILILKYWTSVKNFYQFIKKSTTWITKPSIGDKIKYNIYHKNNHYFVVCRVTDVVYDDSIGVDKFEYDILYYDSNVKQNHNDHWLFKNDNLIQPIHSNNIEIIKNPNTLMD